MNLSGFLGFHIFDDGGIFFWKRTPFKFNDAFFHFASSASFVFTIFESRDENGKKD